VLRAAAARPESEVHRPLEGARLVLWRRCPREVLRALALKRAAPQSWRPASARAAPLAWCLDEVAHVRLSDELCGVLEREPWPLLLVDRERRIRWSNPAWDRAAEEAEAAPALLGHSVRGRGWLEGLAGWQREHCDQLFARALTLPRAPGQPLIEQLSECNTPGQVRRLLTRYVPLGPPGGAAEGVLLCYWCWNVGPPGLALARPAGVSAEALFRTPQGLLVQCGCCRRMRHPTHGTWHHEPTLVARTPAGVSHGLCEVCLELYYGEPVLRAVEGLEEALQCGTPSAPDEASRVRCGS
jgi:hypothetical protein